MYSRRQQLVTPSDFEFPFPPYDIQQQLMETLYTVLEQKGVGILESPTGTGKSLTLTCAALRWLLDHEALVRQELQSRVDEMCQEIKQLDENDANVSDWITAQYATAQRREELSQLQRTHALLQEYEKKLQDMRVRQLKQREQFSVSRKIEPSVREDIVDELQLDDLEDVPAKQHEEDEEKEKCKEEIYKDVKIYFCSRTHSQLAQVVREVKRSSYGKLVRCVSLASRKQLCINTQVRCLPSVALINERCLDLARNSCSNAKITACDKDGCAQKKSRLKSTPTNTKCPYKSATALEELSETSLLQIRDIEELVSAGERSKACPYYAARAASRSAQLIMLPYQLLLHRKTRLQSGIDLRNAVIIIDEAHNLLDTIAQIHSAEITQRQLALVQQQLLAYKMRYAPRFSSANLLKINQLNFIVKRLLKLLTPVADAKASKAAKSRMLRTHELMSEGEFYNINVFHILEFCERTRFAQKLQGFAQRLSLEPRPSENEKPIEQEQGTLGMLKKLQQEHQQRQNKLSAKQQAVAAVQLLADKLENNEKDKLATARISHTSPISPLLAFLATLTECAEDGRVLINIDSAADESNRSSLKYVLLNPGGHFEEIVRDARAIIIAGGTMQPTAELTEQLFKSCPQRVVQRFYDHVVPADAVLPFVVNRGPTGKPFCFNYAQRNSVEMLSELGMTLQNLCNVIPAGMVCFFPSYDFMESACAHMQKYGFLDRISQKKRIFREARSLAVDGQSVEQMLADYAAAIKREEGALLFSVVGGKLSEGLNFADDLGRCVLVVGMPYPNRMAPEMQERMRYLDSTLGAGAGSEYYENLCMKAVNQCIGRSVRHIRDYACVMLLDERYSNERVQHKLPQWIARHLQVSKTFGAIQGATAKFFKCKKQA